VPFEVGTARANAFDADVHGWLRTVVEHHFAGQEDGALNGRTLRIGIVIAGNVSGVSSPD
jgi:hypothetical protein